MIRRLLSAWIGAVFVGALTLPTGAIAKPPDLPEDGKFTLRSATDPSGPFFRLQPTGKGADAWRNHPEPTVNSGVLSDAPRDRVAEAFGCPDCTGSWSERGSEEWWRWLISHWIERQQPPPTERNEGYFLYTAFGVDFAYQAAIDPPTSGNETPAAVIEVLPMPNEEPDITCPYLRQQRTDRHDCHLAEVEIGRDVLQNLKRLEEADKLLDLAKDLASDGYIDEAMECCDRAADLCPGSPYAARANATRDELALASVTLSKVSEEAAEPNLKNHTDEGTEPGIEPMVSGMMKACHLLMSQGMQHQAAELARQAFALDPQRVMADPLVYKMHLLAEMPATRPAGTSEESEPPTCPYCPNAGKPIHDIVPTKKKSTGADGLLNLPHLHGLMPLEIATNAEGEMRLNADCSLGDKVYHVRYAHGCLKVWRTADESKLKQ